MRRGVGTPPWMRGPGRSSQFTQISKFVTGTKSGIALIRGEKIAEDEIHEYHPCTMQKMHILKLHILRFSTAHFAFTTAQIVINCTLKYAL